MTQRFQTFVQVGQGDRVTTMGRIDRKTGEVTFYPVMGSVNGPSEPRKATQAERVRLARGALDRIKRRPGTAPLATR